jgi:hypothetical protein
MFKHAFVLSALAGTFALSAGYAAAADQEQTWRQAQAQQQDELWQPVDDAQERAEYRARMRSLRMPRSASVPSGAHRLMQERARERG